MWYVERLLKTIFSLQYNEECLWFRVIPGLMIMAFLAAKHKMMKFIVKSVKKREFM